MSWLFIVLTILAIVTSISFFLTAVYFLYRETEAPKLHRKGIEKPVDLIREIPMDEWRLMLEEKSGHRMIFPSFAPFMGMGNLMEVRVISHSKVEAELDKALRK